MLHKRLHCISYFIVYDKDVKVTFRDLLSTYTNYKKVTTDSSLHSFA